MGDFNVVLSMGLSSLGHMESSNRRGLHPTKEIGPSMIMTDNSCCAP